MNLRRTIWIANLAALVLLGYVVAGIVRRESDQSLNAPRLAVQAPLSERHAAAMTKEVCSIITRRNIFGSGKAADVVAEAEPARPGALADTKLQLKLLGTVAGDPDIARAVIEDKLSKVQDLYRIGDVVQGAVIKSIERNRVVLARGNRREALELHAGAREPATGQAAARLPDARAAISILAANEFEIDKKAFLAKVGGMEAVFKVARLTPYVAHGKTIGLRITGLENVSMARYVGLQNGDVIQAVNGQKLNSQQKAFQVFRKARAQSALNVNLLRGEREKTLLFRMK